MFTDLVGSTRLRTTAGDDAGDAVQRVHDEAVRSVVDRHDGTVVKGLGDGSLAVFSSARAAVAAAIDLQVELSSGAVGPSAPGLHLRVGLNAGEVREADGDVSGEAVNAASRIADLAVGGEILLSRVVRDLVGTLDLDFVERGDFDLKGFPNPWTIFSVPWSGAQPPTASARSTGLDIRLLGEGAVTLDGRPIDALASTRVLRLFARIAVAPAGRVDRAQLAFDLWPDSSDAQARTNLRKLLHDVRVALPRIEELMQIDSGTIRWLEDAPVRVDVAELRAALERRDTDSVVQLFRCDLLPSCYDEWLLHERDRLRTAACDAMDAAAAEALRAGDPEAALQFGRAVLTADPLRETGYCVCMQALAARGERTEALRTYHRCVEVLERELGVTPDADTIGLYETVREARGRPSVPTSDHATRPRTATTTLVGRERELSAAEAAWQRCAAGMSHLLLVSGEPGIGKSRLVAELARIVTSEGGGTAKTRAYEAAGGLPWGPVTDWLRSDALRARVSRLDEVWLSQIARLVPEARAARADLALSAADAGPTGRRLLFDALVRGLAPEGSPLLLVLDDLQWCDDDTLELLGHLLRSAPSSPLLVAATVRDEELATHAPLVALLTSLTREGRVTDIPLGRLTVEETLRLASEVSGHTIEPAVADRVWADTEGSPLFAVELARSQTMDDAQSALPPTIQAVITARLARLSAPARELSEVAATIGRAFEPSLLAAATASSEDDLIEGLDELWQRQIIREQGTGYDFTHDKLREVLHASISPARRRRLHRDVATALEANHEGDLAPISATLASHYAGAGLSAEAVAAYQRAADYDVSLSALDDAIDCLDHALRHLADLPPGRSRDQTELALCVALGTSLAVRTGYGSDRSVVVYERGVTVCRRLGSGVDPAVSRGLGLAFLVRCDFKRSESLGQQILDAAAADPIALVEGHYLIGVSDFWRGNLDASRAHLETAIQAYRPELRREHVKRFGQDPKAVCLSRLALTRLWQGNGAAATDLALEAVDYAETLDHPPTLAYTTLFGAIGAIERADLDRAAALVVDVEAIFRRYGEFAYYLSVDRLLRAWVELERGDVDGLRSIEAAVDGWRATTQCLHLTYGLTLLARAHAKHGDHEIGRAVVREGLDWDSVHDQRYADPALWIADSDLLIAAGDDGGARASLQRASEAARAQGAQWFERQARARLRALDERSPATP